MTLEDRVTLLERMIDDLREQALRDRERIIELQERKPVYVPQPPIISPAPPFPTPDLLEGWKVT